MTRAVAIALVALLLAGCSAGDDDDAADDTLTEDEAAGAVEHAVLEEDDLGDGWDDVDPPEDDPFGRCFGGIASPLASSGARAFLREGDGPAAITRVLLGTVAVGEPSQLDATFERLGEDSLPACLADAFTSVAGETELGLEVGETDVDDDYLGLDDVRSGRVRIPFRATAPGFELDAELDLVLVARGQLLSSLVTVALGELADGEDIARWSALLADRMRLDR